MKKIKVFFAAAALIISSTAIAGTPTEPTQEQQLNKEIHQLLDEPSFNVDGEMTAFVTFTLNEKGEIVVLNVDSENLTVESFIKSRLNYKKVAMKLNPTIKFYKVPVRLVSA
ncbi:hypothetical protein [Aquimarina brevivitae]|uniref:TonB-like protein n=1 Tax=Aquimarina brevivitae TaxID=323412 RepID=A0A4Q7PMR2_9FLAO|nr:hypothetical protein [Aquimarina brevivitae]RZT00323.1 hypothetical protein EV197_1559 [Aquimarina brevivitae]